MAIVEFGSNSDPLLTWDEAKSQSGAGDTLAINGSERHPTDHFNFDLDRKISASGYRNGTFLPNVGESTRTFRTSGSALSAANNPHLLERFVVNAEFQTNYGLEVQRDSSQDLDLRFSGIRVINGVQYCILMGMRRGSQYFTDIKLEGSPTSGYFQTTGSLAEDGDQDLVINGMDIDGTGYSAAAAVRGVIDIDKIDNLTNDLRVTINDVYGKTTQTGATSTISQVDVAGATQLKVEGCRLTIEASAGISNSFCFLIRGKATAVSSDVRLSNNRFNFYSPSGYGMAFGQSDADTNITAGGVYGNIGRGKYYESNTPHLYVMGVGSTGECVGNAAIESYVGFLMSRTTICEMRGNLAVDCYGPSFFIKGTTACNVIGNVAIQTGALTQRTSGILSVARQDSPTVNTVSATIHENIVIVKDISKIHSLAQITQTLQVCTFQRNIYYIPDTVDVSTELLFCYQSTVPTDTLAAWNARSEVTNDKIIQLPEKELDKLIGTHLNKFVDLKIDDTKSAVLVQPVGDLDKTVRIIYDETADNSEIVVCAERGLEIIKERIQVK